MTLDELIGRLDNTIKGKEQLLSEMLYYGNTVGQVTAKFIQLNLDELRKIRDDVIAVKNSG
jgi:hypothetical protein